MKRSDVIAQLTRLYRTRKSLLAAVAAAGRERRELLQEEVLSGKPADPREIGRLRQTETDLREKVEATQGAEARLCKDLELAVEQEGQALSERLQDLTERLGQAKQESFLHVVDLAADLVRNYGAEIVFHHENPHDTFAKATILLPGHIEYANLVNAILAKKRPPDPESLVSLSQEHERIHRQRKTFNLADEVERARQGAAADAEDD